MLKTNLRDICRKGNEVTKIHNSMEGKIRTKNEIFVYNRIEEKYKKHLCPIIEVTEENNQIKIVMPYGDSLNDKEFERFKNSKRFRTLYRHLVDAFYLEELDLEQKENYRKINNKIVLFNYGHVFCGCELEG